MTEYKNEKFVVIISAMGKTTNALEKVAEAFYNESYIGPGFTQPNPAFNIIAKVDATMANPNRTALLPNDYDWFGEASGTGSIFENNLSFSGGGDKVNYLLSGGFVDQKVLSLTINSNALHFGLI